MYIKRELNVTYPFINPVVDSPLFFFEALHTELLSSERPLLLIGNGVQTDLCKEKCRFFIDRFQIPVVTSFFGTDILESDHLLSIGKVGILGDRAGNFTIQNCDLLICLGCRLAQAIIGYREDWFARNAKLIYIDIDPLEIQKKNIVCRKPLSIQMNLSTFFDHVNQSMLLEKKYTSWLERCTHWKEKWKYEIPPCISITDSILNPYLFLKKFFQMAPENKIIIGSSGSIVTVLWHMIHIKLDDQFIMSSQGDMGFELPASIGAVIAKKNKHIISILGEGSFQLHLQELQTIVHYQLPIKILLFNNGTYGAIEITQTHFFQRTFGVNAKTGLSFPDTEKIAHAYQIRYLAVREYAAMEKCIQLFFEMDGPMILEVFCSVQARCPKISAIQKEDGTFVNRPFEDMEPFMSREEFEKEMIVSPI